MNVYIVRHGTTVWNEKGITQGISKNRLSNKGKEDARKVAKKLDNVKLDAIYTSPLVRTIQTSNIINCTQHTSIIKDERLIEIDQGIFTGRSKDSLTKEEIKLKTERAQSCGLESYQSLIARIRDFFKDLSKLNYKNVLVVTHNCCASVLERIAKNEEIDLDNPKHLRSFTNGEVKLVKIND